MKLIEGFEAPEAFIFLYEKEKFLTLKDGKIEIWTSDGERLTRYVTINFLYNDFAIQFLRHYIELKASQWK